MFTPVESSFGAFLLHLSTTHLLLGNGRVLGASGVLGSAFWKPDGHNIPLLVGMGISALGAWYFDTWWKPSNAGAPEIFGGWTWVICGLLVGVGTKYSNGCTSGHMLCGIPLGRLRSVVAAITFSATCLVAATVVGAYTESPCGSTPCYTPTYPTPARVKQLIAITATAMAITRTSLPLLRKLPQRTAEIIASLWSGALFSLGLMIAGMTNPTKPLGFYSMITDGGKRWDPSFLMIPIFALLPNFLIWRRLVGRADAAPRGGWKTPTKKGIDFKLIAGSAVFGIGWGLLGVCPGPGIVGGFLGGWRGASWVFGFVLGRY
ncbi:hypothetical protein B9Z19DRAFT_1005491 [Tuber borchii]|uniref:Sulphur transport domain-containing protein n=1 Tax=Tuber borchii TaxID=42251 RepID=A0A2T6ZCK3_TUBBO|nr:hypothetical protein B9Z19DRAFT_1005491 [Tuber borchii]